MRRGESTLARHVLPGNAGLPLVALGPFAVQAFVMPRRRSTPPLDRLDRPISLVAQVEQALRRALAERAFPEGKLPTEVELAERFGVSRETVRRAAEVLQREGLLAKYRRRGTLIESHTPRIAWPERNATSRIAYLQANYASEGGTQEAITTGLASPMLHGAIDEAAQSGLDVIVRSARPGELRTHLERFALDAQMRGAVLASFAEEKPLRRLVGRDWPVVLLDHDLHVPRASSIRDDSSAGSRLAVEHLLSLGHRRIAYVHWHLAELNPWRLRGYRDALRRAGLSVRRAWEWFVPVSPQGAESVVAQWRNLSPRPTAILAFNNSLARFLIDALHACDVIVPGDVSIVGLGGEEILELTTCQSDWYDMGRRAVRLLLQSAPERGSASMAHEQIAPKLRPGRTTAQVATS